MEVIKMTETKYEAVYEIKMPFVPDNCGSCHASTICHRNNHMRTIRELLKDEVEVLAREREKRPKDCPLAIRRKEGFEEGQ